MASPNMPGMAADAVTGAPAQLTGALPWPFSWLAGLFVGDRLRAVKIATTPNPYAPVPSGMQLAVAAAQGRQRGLRSGLPGLSGSESDWDTDQGSASVGMHGFGAQDLTSAVLPTSRLIPWAVRNPRDPNTTRGYSGPVITPGSPLIRWGSGTRFAAPQIRAGTLLPPGARTPSPREVVSGYVETNRDRLRLDDPYLDPEDM